MYRYQVLHRQKDENDLFVSSTFFKKIDKTAERDKDKSVDRNIDALIVLCVGSLSNYIYKCFYYKRRN